jgi:hypothetical protein
MKYKRISQLQEWADWKLRDALNDTDRAWLIQFDEQFYRGVRNDTIKDLTSNGVCVGSDIAEISTNIDMLPSSKVITEYTEQHTNQSSYTPQDYQSGLRSEREDAIIARIDQLRGRGRDYPESEVPGVIFIDGAWRGKLWVADEGWYAVRFWEGVMYEFGRHPIRGGAEQLVVEFNKAICLTGYGADYGV